MRILHTSDWHLGAYLEQHSRLDEQYEFIDELTAIADEKSIDLIIVAGDVYDTSNPPANAERLFYYAVERLSGGKRPLLITAGNHDSPERLSAPKELLYKHGAIVLGLPNSSAFPGDYGFYKIVDSQAGWVEIEIGGERVVAITMPFPSEKRLNEVLGINAGEADVHKSFNDKMEGIFKKLSQNFRDDSINIVAGHFHISGGERSDSERDIQLGGSFALNSGALPKNAQYIAMGHLHRAQKIAGINNGFYSGSPIQYSKSEILSPKCVYIADIKPGEQAVTEKQYLRCYKPIEIWEAASIDAAIEMCSENKDRNCWVYLKINTDRPMLRTENKQIIAAKKDIVKITLSINGGEDEIPPEEYAEKTILEEFADFYKAQNSFEPPEEVIALFQEILSGVDDE